MNNALFFLGIILLIGGVIAYGYTVVEDRSYFFGAYTESDAVQPYRDYAWPLGIIGIVLIVVSLALTTSVTERTVVHETPTRVRRTKTVIEED